MQVKLLRGIQEKAIRPVGGQQEIPVDVRILSATHRDLAREVDNGNFRQDLFYRINVIELKVPSLRDRRDDIPLLAKNLLGKIADEYEIPLPKISTKAMDQLRQYSFPGNVRELQNILERAITLCEDDVIDEADLALTPQNETAIPPDQSSRPEDDSTAEEIDTSVDSDPGDNEPEPPPLGTLPEDAESLESYLEDIEKHVIVEALEATRWNKTAAAKKLGITFRALRYKLKKLNLD